MHQPGKFPSKKASGPQIPALPSTPPTKAYFDPNTFRPLMDLVLLKLVVDEDPLIQLPESVKNRERRAIVEKVGPGRVTDWGHKIVPEFEPGQHVYLAPGAGFPLEVMNKTTAFIIARPNEILGIFEDSQSPAAAESPAVLPDHSGEGDLGTSVLETSPPESKDRPDEAVAGQV